MRKCARSRSASTHGTRSPRDASSEDFEIETDVIARDGTPFASYAWLPAGTAKAIVTIAHGLAEHASRYDEFARALNAAGYAVYASDHRGHGPGAAQRGTLGDLGPNGFEGIVDDLALLAERARAAHPNVPLFLFGHSMGSVLAQRAIEERATGLAGVVLCGTFGAIEGLDGILQFADSVATGDAATAPSVLQPQMFAAFNVPFEPKTTGFEWLSRDPAQVRAYADDPLCGFPLTNASLAVMLHGFAAAWNGENEARIPTSLPVLVIAGAEDPAGAATGSLQALVGRYRSLGIADLTETLYPHMRHEILNEIDREVVYRDVVAWFDAHLGA